MVVVMSPGAAPEAVQAVVDRVRAEGVDAFVSRGVSRTIVGLVGDVTRFQGPELRQMTDVAEVMRISKPYKLVSRDNHPQRSVVEVGGTPIGPGTVTLIAGPCAVESHEQTLEAAQMAKDAGASLIRGGAFKPRTSPVRVPGTRPRRAPHPGRRPRAGGSARRHRGRRRARRARGRRARRHAPGRHAQHAELRAPAGRRRVGPAGAAEARAHRDVRGVAHGGRVRRAARQPRRRALRAGRADLRDRDAQHPRRLRGPGGAAAEPPAGRRRPPATRAASGSWSCRCRAPASPSGPTG